MLNVNKYPVSKIYKGSFVVLQDIVFQIQLWSSSYCWDFHLLVFAFGRSMKESHWKTNKQTNGFSSPSRAVQFRKSSGLCLYSLCQHCLPVINPSAGEKKGKKITEGRTYWFWMSVSFLLWDIYFLIP